MSNMNRYRENHDYRSYMYRWRYKHVRLHAQIEIKTLMCYMYRYGEKQAELHVNR